jgi:cytochrome c553
MQTRGFDRVMIAALVGTSLAAAIAQGKAQTLEERTHNCDVCHGKDGKPRDKMTPVIWGQNQGYIYIQLRDYKKGSRQDDIMSDVCAELSREDMMALAEHYSQKPWPNLGQPSASKDIVTQSLRANASIGCTGCHLDEYLAAGTAPRLAGQRREYLEKTMLDFRSRQRGNNPGMSDLMAAASPEDLTALAEFLAGL